MVRLQFVLGGVFFGTTGAQNGVQKSTLNVDGLTRTYYTQMPNGEMPSAGWPLVLSFHGWCGSASSQASTDNLRTYGQSSAIIVHAEGESDGTDCPSWNGGGSAGGNTGGTDGPICNPSKLSSSDWKCYPSCQAKGFCSGSSPDKCRWSHCNDDVAFVLAMIDAEKQKTTVDESRIFATGHSNGAMFMYELASDSRSAHVFAALAPTSGLPHNGFNRGSPNTDLRFIEFSGKSDTYVYPYPNVPSDATKSYGTDYGWYYSAWENTTDLWGAQRGLSNKGTLSSSQSGLECHGWSSDGTAAKASVALCFYNGAHSSPATTWKQAWEFFGFDTPQPSGNCPKTCDGYTCDEWYDYNGNTCAYEEANFGCDCSGCECKGGELVL
jgi:polyhydroxybutyrate depolymerase